MNHSRNNFDLIVIGSGPGGQKAALQGAKAGKRVAIIERYPAVGGSCVYSATLPSKSFRESVYRFALGSQGILGQEMENGKREKPKHILPDMTRLLRRRDRVVSMEAQIIFNQLKRNSVQIFHGNARLKSDHEVEILSDGGNEVLNGQFILIATGARPVLPKHLPPIDGRVLFDSNTILSMKKVPRTMVVLGAGTIGCEYASMFLMAGTHVSLVDKRKEILASVDREIVQHLSERFLHFGMDLNLGCETETVETRGDHAVVKLSSGRVLEVEAVLVCLGRHGNSDDLGLERVGIQPSDRGLIEVDSKFRTKVKGIYAVGDVVGFPALASTSMEQGRIACCDAFNLSGEVADVPENYPYGIYTIPEISMIGPTEEELLKQKRDFVVGRARYRELARGQIVGDQWGILKILVDRQTLKILGVHILGDNAADLIHIGQAVMTFDGDVTYFLRTVFNYPALAEAYKTAAFHAINLIRGKTTTL